MKESSSGRPAQGTAQGIAQRSRELLDLDPERPAFLVLPQEKAKDEDGNQTRTGQTETLREKPKIGPVEASSVLSSARAFLASAPQATAGLSTLGQADPEIAPVAAPPVRLPG